MFDALFELIHFNSTETLQYLRLDFNQPVWETPSERARVSVCVCVLASPFFVWFCSVLNFFAARLMELNKCKLIPTDRWKTSGRKCDRMRPATRSCRSSGSKNAMTCASSSPTPSPKPTNPTICSPPGKSSSKNWLMLIAVSSLGHFHFHFHLKISNCCYWLLHDAALITFQSALSFMAFVWGFFEIL